MQILHSSTAIALWQDIVHHAEAQCEIQLNEELECYLILLLERYTNQPDMVKQIIATEFLNGMEAASSLRQHILQQVGDKCLIFSGLFPKLAIQRQVQISYFVRLGQSSYANISKKRHDLYHNLASSFVNLMDILQSIRVTGSQYPDLLPLEAYELWDQTGSKRSLKILKQYTNGVPISLK